MGIRKDTKKTAKDMQADFDRAMRISSKNADAMGESWRRASKRIQESASVASKAIRDSAREGKRGHADAARAANSRARSEETAARRTQAAWRRSQREAERFARRTSHRATRFLLPNAPIGSIAARGGREVLRGLGVRTGVQENISNIVDQGRLANQVSTQAFRQGAEGAAGRRVAPRVLEREARDTQREFGIGSLDVLQGARAFVGQRGNLEGFRQIQSDLAKRAVGQGIDFQELSLTAAKIDSALVTQEAFARDDEKRNQAVLELLDNFIQQGKVGSIEGAELAKQIPKLSGIAAGFSGSPVKALQELVTLTQLAERGPGKNAAQSSTFVQNAALDISKRSEAFKKFAGVDVFDSDGKLRSLLDVFTETIRNTEQTRKFSVRGKGRVELNQVQQLQNILPNKRSFLALQELLNVFKGAGGGAKGEKALRAEFTKFGGSNRDQLQSDLDAARATTANKITRLNAKIETIAANAADRLIPALEKMEPALLNLVEVIGRTATWMVENPKLAIGAAIGLAIARAGVESMFRAGIERIILGARRAAISAAGAPLAGPGGGGPAVLGGARGGRFGGLATGVTLAAGALGGQFIKDQINKGVSEEEQFRFGAFDKQGNFDASTFTPSGLGKLFRDDTSALAKRLGTSEDDTRKGVDVASTALAAHPLLGAFAGATKLASVFSGLTGGDSSSDGTKQLTDEVRANERATARVEQAIHNQTATIQQVEVVGLPEGAFSGRVSADGEP